MNNFTKTDVTRKFAEIARATFRGPVIITENGKKRHVIMNYDDYNEMVKELHDLKVSSSEGAVTPTPD